MTYPAFHAKHIHMLHSEALVCRRFIHFRHSALVNLVMVIRSCSPDHSLYYDLQVAWSMELIVGKSCFFCFFFPPSQFPETAGSGLNVLYMCDMTETNSCCPHSFLSSSRPWMAGLDACPTEIILTPTCKC